MNPSRQQSQEGLNEHNEFLLHVYLHGFLKCIPLYFRFSKSGPGDESVSDNPNSTGKNCQ